MSDKYLEKTFLYLVALSVLLHVAVFAVVVSFPPENLNAVREPTMVELTDLPRFHSMPQGHPPDTKSAAVMPRNGIRKAAREEGRQAKPNRPPVETGIHQPRHSASASSQPFSKMQPSALPPLNGEPASPGEGLFKPKTEAPPERPPLFPSAFKMAQLEESYRKKYETEAEENEAKFLNTDDIQFGSFLRHFENAVYGVWNYPRAAAERGVEGVTAVRITFNRGGEIFQVAILKKSGSEILDDEVTRILKLIGPVGSFPKGFTRDTFNLIAFFQYRISGMRLI